MNIYQKIDQWNEYSKKIGELVKKYDMLLTNAVKLRPNRLPDLDKDGKPKFEDEEKTIQKFFESMPNHPIYGRPATKDEIAGHMQEFESQFAAIIKEIQSLKL